MATVLNGIDVSQFQGNIDWNKVKASGNTFVMIRMGWTYYEGGLHIEAMFEKNIAGATAAGLDVGIYVYGYDQSAAAAKISAQKVLEAVKKYKLTYPIAYDIEDQRNFSYGKALNTAIAKAFCETIEAAKYYALVYTYTAFSVSYLNLQDLKQFDFWVADYRTKALLDSQFKLPYGMWQYIGDAGKVDGVPNSCDRNYAYRDYAATIKSNNLNHLTDSAPGQPVQETDDVAALKAQIASLKEEIVVLNKNIETAAAESSAFEKTIKAYEEKFQQIKTIVG